MKPHESIEELKRSVLLQALRKRNSPLKVETPTTHIPQADRSQPLPLSWAQQSLWFLVQLDPTASAAYNMPVGLRLRGTLDKDALKASLDRIIGRHEVLRTVFVTADDEPKQQIAEGTNGFSLQEQNLSKLPHKAQEQAIADICRTQASQAFDLATGPLISGRLLQLADDEHVLLITQHHIISDGWSMGRLVEEFSALYTAFSQSLDDPLPPLPIQYADYAVWQRQWLQGEKLHAQIDFWKNQLSGAPGLLELPTDFPRPAQQSYVGSRVDFTLSSELTAQLKQFSQHHNVTLFMSLLAGWSVLMARLSGSHDVVIGSPVANRPHAGLESLIGFFANTLVLRVQLDDGLSTAQLLKKIKATTLAAYSHQDLPFEQLVEALKPARSLSHSPLFQVMLALNNTPGGGELVLPGLTLSAQTVEQTTTPFDLNLSVSDLGHEIAGHLHYATDLFTADTVTRWIHHFETLLGAMVHDDGQAVSRLPLLSAADSLQLLHGFNATEADFSKHHCIQQLFEQQAEKTPDAVALVFEEQSLSYAELNRAANHLAHELLALGIRPDDRVVICVERSLAMVIGLLGILKAGAAYVPLDPSYPEERLAFMLADCAPVAVLTQQALHAQQSLWGGSVPVIFLDALDGNATEHANPSPLALGLSSDNLAYVIYTSGSTGQPKGVMIHHSALVNFLGSMSKAPGILSADTLLAVTTLSFDIAGLELLLPLINGAKTVVLSREAASDPTLLAAAIDKHAATLMQATPATWQLLLQGGWQGSKRLKVLCGGEALNINLSTALQQKVGELWNLYGPTETTVWSSCQKISAASNAGRALCEPIGTPIANTQIYILDAYLQAVPIGVVGELYIGGAGVARGYLNREELTAERFIANPFRLLPPLEKGGWGGFKGLAGGLENPPYPPASASSGQAFSKGGCAAFSTSTVCCDNQTSRLYKTGDLARWLPDGSIEYLGRNDFQVKLRGFRIELGEIEAQLLRCTGVREAVVVAREDTPGDKRLVAYVLPEKGHEPSVADLRSQLSATLADYMLPSAFVMLDAFPLTPNGKLDRKALPALDASAVMSRTFEAPIGEIETGLAGIWQSLLAIDQVGRHDSFFELGGHSLLAVQFVARVRHVWGIELTLRELFMSPVLSGLAAIITKAKASDLPAIVPVDRSQPLPLSWAQQRLWFLVQLDSASSQSYNMPAGLRLKGRLDKSALQASFDRILARHEILRTVFITVDGEPRQVIAPEASRFALIGQDLSQLDSEDQAAVLETICHAEASHAFDLVTGPLIRGRLLKLAGDEHVLLITLHHIISDGWSVGRLVDEFGALYTAFSQAQDDPLPPLTVQYADYAVWQRHWLQGEPLRQQTAFWRDYLEDSPPLLELPTDFARPTQRSHQGDAVEFIVPRKLTAAVKQLADDKGVTLFMTLLTAWGILLSRLSDQTDVVVGAPVATRQLRELEPLVGLFLNSLPLRLRLDDNPTVAELLASVKDSSLKAFAHQHIPFEQIVETRNPERSTSYSPLFQVWLNLNNTPRKTVLTLPGLELSPVEFSQTVTQFDLTLSLTEQDDYIAARLEYSKDLFKQPTVYRFANYFINVLTAMTEDAHKRVNQLAWITPEEQQQIIKQFNPGKSPFITEKPIHALFEAQAERCPDAFAATFADQSVNYAELNAKANQLAQGLLREGVGPDTLVAVCLERSLDMLVAILGILKAGGAYVPVDPDTPQERIAFILQDTAAPVLVTRQALTANLPDKLPKLLCVDDSGLALNAKLNPSVALHPSNLAYVIYTSGSTGQPKGVLVSHQNIIHSTTSRLAYYEDPIRAYLLLSPFTFDSSVAGLFWTLAQGACLCLPTQNDLKDPRALAAIIDRHQVSHLLTLPSFYQLLLDQDAHKLRSLTTVIVAGEACTGSVVDAHFKILPEVKLFNEYGPTEGTVWSSVHRIQASDTSTAVPIGKPISHAKLYLLDKGLMPVPVGVKGEIYIGGAGVAQGYLNRADLTAERFIPDRFADDGSRMYKSGDLGCYRADGAVEFLGRIDHQVKIRGFRIELGEIEAQLSTVEGVQQAAVIVHEDKLGNKRLVAYLQTGQELSAQDLRAHLAAVLPEYMLPNAFFCLERFPLTTNGKLDRRALPSPDKTAVETDGVEPLQTDNETALAGLWQDLLDIERVGRNDHFFELGGHSLLAITLVEQLQQQGFSADVMAVFTEPVLKDMAATLSKNQEPAFTVPPNLIRPGCTAITPELLPLVTLTQAEIDTITDTIPLGATNIQDIYPLSPLQEGMLFHHLLSPEGDAYLMRLLFKFDSRSRLDGFLSALQTVIDRHDILRTAVCWQGLSKPVQIVQRQAPLPVHELTATEGVEALQQLMAVTDTAHARLDLQKAPLFAATVIQDSQTGAWHAALLNHHIVRDHVSGELILAEVKKLLAGQGSSLPVSWPYRNYIAQAQTVSLAEHEAYFQQQLADLETPTTPFGISDTQNSNSRIAEVTLPLEESMAQAIRACAKQQGVSAAILFHAAWALVLAQCSGQDDVVFGTVLMGRTQGQAGSDQALGMFMNTLPVRLQAAQHSVETLVQACQQRLTGLLRHEQAPLALAQRCSAIPASLPLFSSLLNYRHSDIQAVENDAAVWEGIELQQLEERTNYPVTLSVNDFGQGFSLTAQCVDSVDPSRMAAYMATAISALVKALNQQPTASVSQLSILPAQEWQQVVQDFNGTDAPYPEKNCIHELFEQQAAQTPDAIALVFEGQRLTYRQLNRKANQLAHQLIALGVRPDDRVAVCAERSLEMVIGLLGILKSGGAYVPLDPGYPEERLAFMLSDCAPVAVLTQSALQAELPLFNESLQLPVIVLDAPTKAKYPEHNPSLEELGLSSRNLAYVIYTSGSTGQPKGVMNEHQAVVNRLWWAQQRYAFNPHDRILQKTPYSFDVSVWEFFSPLIAGSQLIIAKPKGHQEPEYLAGLVASTPVTALHFVPSMLPGFLDQVGQHAFPALRRVFVSGEALPLALQNRFHAVLPGVELHNHYGPTEAAVEVTYWHCRQDQNLGFVPIGYPIANTQMYILNTGLQPVPVSVTGELYIGGVAVARGYINRPELTAERFIGNPFRQGSRLYKTGDLARWLPDGSIEYLGRNDFQVKIRGFRIELGEIEAQLIHCPGVKEAVVIAREDSPGDQRLVAYLIAQDGQTPTAAAIRDQLSSCLADYMLPGAVVVLEAFPLTASGKLDRKALPAPDGSAVISRPFEAPQTNTESLIAGIWQDLLHLNQIGRHDHFFELGGHSLLVVSLIERLRQQGFMLAVRTVFNTPVLADMAALLDEQHTHNAPAPVPPNLIPEGCTALTPELLPLVNLTQAEIDGLCKAVSGGASTIQDIYPLAPLQEGILFHHLLETQGDTYLLRSVLSFETRELLDAFLSTLQTVIDRHAILRTAIHWQGLPQALQVVHRKAVLPVTGLDLHSDSQESVYDKLLKHTDPGSLRLDLQHAPLFAAYTAFDAQTGGWLLSLLNHHLVCDHVTLEFVIAEIRQILAGQTASLPTPRPYRNFIAQALSLPQAEHEAYFRQQLGDIDTPTAPFDIFGGNCITEASLPFDTNLAHRIRNAAKQQGVTAAVLFHLAWAEVLAQCTGQDDIVFGTVLMGRLQGSEDADRVLGLFINTLPIRFSLAGRSVRELVSDTQRNLSGLLDHEQASLALAQRCSAVEAPLPLFTTLFNYRHSATQSNPSAANELSVWQGIKAHHAEERTNYPVTLSVDDFGLDFSVTAQCVAGIKPERIAAYLETAVRKLVEALELHPDSSPSALSMLPETEWQQVVHGFNAGTAQYPQPHCLHALFEQQAAQNPGAVALVYEGQSLSYDQLNRKANRIAHQLIALGIRPDDRVGLCVERSLDMVIGLLGILKAGAAYVPLDPSYPEERLVFMLKDAAPRALLTPSALRSELSLFDGDLQVPVVLLDDIDDSKGLEHNPDVLGLDSSHLAYVIYTSGSTGQPKGVMVSHANVGRLFAATQVQFEFSSNDVWTLFHSFAFDFSVWELWGALLFGGRVVVVPYATSRDPDAFYALLCHEHVTVLNQTPSSFRQLMTAQAKNPREHALRTIVFGGEALEFHSLKPWIERNSLGRTQLVNMYGITETTVHTTYRCLTKEDIETGQSSNIGTPLADLQVYVLDRYLRPVPVGVTGELYIGGDGVASGYLNLPELTSERFIENPFGPTTRLYKTGDLGRWLEDGSLEYLGRNDFQVKIRGFRIELGEIESRLSKCTGVREAVVIAREDVPGDKRLVAYLTVNAGYEVSAADLRNQLSATLADYMLPGAFVVLEAFPLTHNGKLDRKALPAPDSSAAISRAFEMPLGETETVIAGLWKDLLHLNQVGRYDHFFELGGHSLLAVQLASRVNQALGVDVPLRNIFALPVLHDFANSLFKQPSDLSKNLVAIRTTGSQAPLFLVHPAGGEINYARELATWIDEDIPVHGLAATGFMADEIPVSSVEEMVDEYIKAMRQVQAQGPYHIAGWSAGGTIAYAIAEKLIGSDDSVAFVGLIDTAYQYQPADSVSDEAILISYMQSIANDANLNALAGTCTLDDIIDYCRKTSLLPKEIDNVSVRRKIAVCKAIVQAVSKYYMQMISAPLTLFAAQENESFEAYVHAWQAIAADTLNCIPVNGSHLTLVEPPFVQELGKAISEALSQCTPDPTHPEHSYSPLVMLQKGQPAVKPLFCVPGAGANAAAFYNLSQAVDASLPVYAMQPRGLEGVLVPHSDVQSAATAYINAMRSISPSGPYRLMGHSFGGWVVFEMALQLLSRGEQLKSLIIVDSEAPLDDKKRRCTRIEMLMKLVELFELNLDGPINLMAEDFTGLDDNAQLKLLLARLVDVKLVPPTMELKVLRGIVRVFEANLNTAYAPNKVYQAPVHLVSVKTVATDEKGCDLGAWQQVAPYANLTQSSGNHLTLLNDPHVTTLAGLINTLSLG